MAALWGHSLWSGVNRSHGPQFWASHGVTASLLHHRQLAGTRLASTSRGEAHAYAHCTFLVAGIGFGRSLGTRWCQYLPRWQRSCDCYGSLYSLSAEVLVSIVRQMCIEKILRCSCRASLSAVWNAPAIIFTPSFWTACSFLTRVFC